MDAYPTKGWRKMARDLFTGPDGETWAYGRLAAVPVLASGLSAPFVQLANHMPVSLAELAVLLPATAGAVMLLVTGTNPTEPKAPEAAAPKAN